MDMGKNMIGTILLVSFALGTVSKIRIRKILLGFSAYGTAMLRRKDRPYL